jgi:hypothetical protein
MQVVGQLDARAEYFSDPIERWLGFLKLHSVLLTFTLDGLTIFLNALRH